MSTCAGTGCRPRGCACRPLETLLAPSFEWPGLLFPVVGSSTFRASAPELRYLNGAVVRFDGWFSFATCRLAVETTLLTRAFEVAAPEGGR